MENPLFFDRYLGGFSEKRMIQIAAGYTHCLGLTDVSFDSVFCWNAFGYSQDGTVYATGINAHGQLGLGNNHD